MTVADIADPVPESDRPASTRGIQSALDSVWNDHPDQEYRRDLAHWRGHGRWDEVAWSGLVETTARRVRDLCRSGGLQPEPATTVALDWGCGGGSGLVALAPICARLYGVDVSPANLRESERQLELLDEPMPTMTTLLAGADPSIVGPSIEQPIDLLVSVLTFHLLPDKDLGADILRTAFAIMSPGALGYVTIRYDDGTPKYAPRQGAERYLRDHIYASSWQISEFWELLEATGFSPMKVANVNTAAHFCSFYFKK